MTVPHAIGKDLVFLSPETAYLLATHRRPSIISSQFMLRGEIKLLALFYNWSSRVYHGNFECRRLIRGTVLKLYHMMTSSYRHSFLITGLCEGNPSVTGGFPSWRPVIDVFFDLHLKNGWANNRDTGDSIRHRIHYDVTMINGIETICL